MNIFHSIGQWFKKINEYHPTESDKEMSKDLDMSLRRLKVIELQYEVIRSKTITTEESGVA